METLTANTFSFDDFELDGAKRLLLKKGQTVALNSKTFDLLLVLVENRGQVLSKDELLGKVWANQFVEENNLTVQISALRKILGEKKDTHQFIVTVPGKGYSFVAELNDQPNEFVIENHNFSRIVVDEIIENEKPDEIGTTNKFAEYKKTKQKPSVLLPVLLLIIGVGFVGLTAAFWIWKNEKQIIPPPIELKKITNSGRISNVALTPDGKYAVLAQTENDGESLWLRQIETGSQMQILPAKAVKYVGLTVAPDGNLIYATVFGGDMPDPQIWKMPLLGGVVEEIKDIKTGAAISLSPDGQQFAFTESRSALNETHFGIANADGTNKQILIRASDAQRSFPNFDTNPAAWSPDGSEIASVVEGKSADGATKSRILLINPIDGSEKYISEQSWAYVGQIIWANAENLVATVFTQEPRRGQILTISRKDGEVRQITNDLNTYSKLASGNGKLLTIQKNAVSHIRLTDFDETAQTLQSREIFKESGFISNVSFSPDGKIFYSSTASGKPEIWSINEDGTNPMQMTADAAISFGMSVSPADGAIVFCATEKGRHFLRIVNANGKNMRPLTDGAEDVFPNFTNDAQAVIFQRGLNNKTLTLWRLELSDGKVTQLTQTQASHPAISPDGRLTAHYFMDKEIDNLWRVKLISSINGESAGKINLPPNAVERRMRWHPNGKFLTDIFYKNTEANLLLLPIDGGKPREFFGFGKGDVNWFEWSPDGRKLVISQTEMIQDAVLILDSHNF